MQELGSSIKKWWTIDVVAVGSNAIGVVAAGFWNSIGIVAVSFLNAMGLVVIGPRKRNGVRCDRRRQRCPESLPLAASTPSG